jgi:hypothetical protein
MKKSGLCIKIGQHTIVASTVHNSVDQLVFLTASPCGPDSHPPCCCTFSPSSKAVGSIPINPSQSPQRVISSSLVASRITCWWGSQGGSNSSAHLVRLRFFLTGASSSGLAARLGMLMGVFGFDVILNDGRCSRIRLGDRVQNELILSRACISTR